MRRKIRMGMIGGGEGAFIGAIHRMAAALDGQIELVCGAFSSDPEKSKRSGEKLFLDPNRVYNSFEEMIDIESSLSSDIRMDFVSIVTPNHLHFAPAKMALLNGFNVLVDKPLCFDLNEAQELKSIVDKSKLLFAVSYNYTAYPMVKQAKAMIDNGVIGTIKKVVVEYSQGWLTTAIEKSGQKQASWRTDPSKAGKAGALGDIGSHAQNLAEHISGLKIDKLCAQVNTMVDGRSLDDDTNILLKFNNGASGVLIASQVSAGEENNLKIRLYGELGGLEWSQMNPNDLIYRGLNQVMQVLRTGSDGLDPSCIKASRLPAGHPEGYIEAFANIYKSFSNRILDQLNNENNHSDKMDFPDINDGLRGMLFIEKAIESGQSGNKWITIE